MKKIIILFLFFMLLGWIDAHAQGTVLGWDQPNRKVQTTFGTSRVVVPTIQIPIVGGIDPADTSGVPLQFDGSTGALKVLEQSPSANNYRIVPGFQSVMAPVPETYVQASLFANRDSTQIIDCRGYNRAALYFLGSATAATDKGGGDADSLAGGVFALSIRAHTSSTYDSTSTFVVPVGIERSMAAGTQYSDSIGSITDMYVNTATVIGGSVPQRNRAFSWEKVFVAPGPQSVNRGRLIWSNKIGDKAAALPPFSSWHLRYLKSYTNVTGVMTAVADSIAGGALGGLPMRVGTTLVLWRE